MIAIDNTVGESLETALPSPISRPDGPPSWHWQLVGQVGQGTWADVYRARPENTPADRPAAYAVKMLHEKRWQDPVAIEMLAREARVGRQVSHPHLIAILESQLKRAPQFLVMPWLEGATLHSYTSSRRLLDPPAVLWIARQIAEALAALDQAGWMHGDVKPSNIFLSPLGHATLLDLGFARHRDERSDSPRAIAGTGYYLARSKSVPSFAPTSAATFIAWASCSIRCLPDGCLWKARRSSNWPSRISNRPRSIFAERRRTCRRAWPSLCIGCWPKTRCGARNLRPN